MAGRIPESFIDELMARTDIVEVIGERVALKRAGKDYKACCPFHDEKTPSFTVSPDKQFYHCFGCGAHGTAIGFLMDHGRLEFPEAVEELARRAGLEVPREGGRAEREERSAPLLEALEAAARFYRRQLREHPRAARAVDYLKARGVSGETAAAFGLGYAPPGWDSLAAALGREPAGRRVLVAAGLLVEREGGGCYDRFRDRITFPIRDRRGRTIAFGARALGDEQPKYLNSPETAVFHKGRELYGVYEARRAAGTLERLLVVEGYMDVVALAQHGLPWAVAVLGTAVTGEHVERLFRTAPEVIFCFDGDRAGRAAAWRALESALPALAPGRGAAFLLLPDGEDPDSLVRREGREAFERRLGEARSLTEHLFAELTARTDTATLEGRARLVELARPLLARLPDGALRRLARNRLAELVHVAPEELSTLFEGGERRPPRGAPPARVRPSLVRQMLALVVHYPRLAARAGDPEPLRAAGLPGSRLLAEVIELLHSHPNLSSAGLVEHFRDHPEGRHLGRLLAAGAPPSGEGLEREFLDGLERLAGAADERRFRELQQRAASGQLEPAERQEFARLAARRTSAAKTVK